MIMWSGRGPKLNRKLTEVYKNCRILTGTYSHTIIYMLPFRHLTSFSRINSSSIWLILHESSWKWFLKPIFIQFWNFYYNLSFNFPNKKYGTAYIYFIEWTSKGTSFGAEIAKPFPRNGHISHIVPELMRVRNFIKTTPSFERICPLVRIL